MDTAEASETTMAPWWYGGVRRILTFLSLGQNYVNYMDVGEPCNFDEACRTPDANLWHIAMKSEMDSLYAHDTWEIVPLPTNKKALPCKWVFSYKYVLGTEQPKYKSRLVAKAFKEE